MYEDNELSTGEMVNTSPDNADSSVYRYLVNLFIQISVYYLAGKASKFHNFLPLNTQQFNMFALEAELMCTGIYVTHLEQYHRFHIVVTEKYNFQSL